MHCSYAILGDGPLGLAPDIALASWEKDDINKYDDARQRRQDKMETMSWRASLDSPLQSNFSLIFPKVRQNNGELPR